MKKFSWGIILILISLIFIYGFITNYYTYKEQIKECQEFNEKDITLIGTEKKISMDCSVWEFKNLDFGGYLIIIILTLIIGIILLLSHFNNLKKIHC
jgi:hypothetical protein